MLVSSIILICYSITLIVLIIGWKKASQPGSSQKSASTILITVLIPFRNEEENLVATLRSLGEQIYENFEVIAINDHSSDSSVETLKQVSFANFMLVENVGQGKKMAITTGVSFARGEIIVTTDGDCLFSRDWLKTIAQQFADQNVHMVFGPVKLKQSDKLFSNLQAIEFSSLIGSAVALHALGTPVMCNGANLAYRKKVFFDVDGFDGNLNIPSGDDEFLMRKIMKAKPDGIRYLGNNGVVIASPKSSVMDFFQQRLRWAGKWRHNSSFFAIFVAILVVIIQIAWLVLVTSLFVFPISVPIGLTVVVKVLIEFYFLRLVCLGLKINWSFSAFLLLQLIYPLYVISVGIGSNFVSYSWKGRKVQ
jgi:cellulose synthase/poly-beta-1,6-N-acetylglucosamine synthase-like glycosyltransferase